MESPGFVGKPMPKETATDKPVAVVSRQSSVVSRQLSEGSLARKPSDSWRLTTGRMPHEIDFSMKFAINPGPIRINFLMISTPCLPSGESCLMRAICLS
jgi:hypothetical protein